MISNCPICNIVRTYKTKAGYIKGLSKPCRTCANSISRGGTGAKYVDEKIKCSKCKTYLDSSEFYFRTSTNKPYSYCKSCHVTSSSSYYKEVEKFDRYGITKEDYNNFLTNQEGKCEGCKVTMSTPYIDHCHKTGKVRGLLCRDCNSALGLLKDSAKTLKNLIIYLKGDK